MDALPVIEQSGAARAPGTPSLMHAAVTMATPSRRWVLPLRSRAIPAGRAIPHAESCADYSQQGFQRHQQRISAGYDHVVQDRRHS
jgi:hypothetical protein